MFKIVELVNGRFNLHLINPEGYNILPHHIVLAILWRTYPTREAAAEAAKAFNL